MTLIAPCCHDRIGVGRPAPLADQDAPEDLAREARRQAAGQLTGVTDGHVHLFPDAIYHALWRWFDAHAWDIAFRGTAEQTLAQLALAGTHRVVALVFSHKPGLARHLNAYLAGVCRSAPHVVGVGTVLPGEPGAREIVREAIEVHGLRGIKLHCHVQKVAIDDPATLAVLAQCAALGVPAVVHAGREPASAAYGVDTRTLCGAARTELVLRTFPHLRLVVPHLGADEYPEYLELLSRHEHLYLDTAMACAEYFAHRPDWQAVTQWSHRILYGTDFPILPYPVDRELRVLARRVPDDAALHRILRGTAARLWHLT